MAFVLPRQSPPLWELATFVMAACDAAKQATGARVVALFGEGFTVPAVTDASEGSMFVKMAGRRACVIWVFDGDLPRWLGSVNSVGHFPPMSLVERQHGERFMRWRPETDPAATVASLVLYLETLLEWFVEEYPHDADVFPELDDAAVARMFE